MENNIKKLEIKNFKSIKDLSFDCKRINIFIGKPNVGKSNILEAISLLGFTYEMNMDKYLSSFIRYEEFSNLFYDDDFTNLVEIKSDNLFSFLKFFPKEGKYYLYLSNSIDTWEFINNDKDWTFSGIETDIRQKKEKTAFITVIDKSTHNYINLFDDSHIKKYDFNKNATFDKKNGIGFLSPPFGKNLFSILSANESLSQLIASFFLEYNLELLFKPKENKLSIQKRIGNRAYEYPYSTIADTLQRIIFYFTAIESNKNSILVLEEPEVHAFPPYTVMLADKIMSSTDNQFFITTHSPYLLHSIIENTDFEELGVFITYFEAYETKVKMLSKEELRDILDDSISIFFNLDRFLANE
jgi:hypothetical protein